ncbi:MAG: undecaprenyl diphosphate synthase family protein [Candidatus Woesearchaeota archaeon]|nr:undecaprenyl diphosphate synthase family protein [Candidatus Woesearchaeota archaeon]
MPKETKQIQNRKIYNVQNRQKNTAANIKKNPKHIAIDASEADLKNTARKPVEYYKKIFSKTSWLLNMQIKLNIPIVTINLFNYEIKESEDFPVVMDALVDFFSELKKNPLLNENKVKVSVLGKWYDLPGRVIEALKPVIDETRDYDSFFLNICLNYDGKEEIIDACKIIAKKIQAGKMDAEAINKEAIKDNIYSSYFLPPDMLIKLGNERKLHGFLLWDATESYVYFSTKSWLEFDEKHLYYAIKEWKKSE